MQLPNQKGKTKLLFQRCKWEDKEVILDWDDIYLKEYWLLWSYLYNIHLLMIKIH